MKNQKALLWLVSLIVVLSLLAAGAGIFYQTPGEPYAYTSLRGEQVTINNHGLYFYDTVSSAVQTQANDFVTLVLGLPLLVASAWLAMKGSLRGHLLMTGTLGFFLYTYMSMSFLAAYNALFLVYVALFSLSLLAFVISMIGFDLKTLPAHFSQRMPRGWIAGVLFAGGGFLLLAWLGRILPTLSQKQLPLLENTTTLVIQAMDLGLIVPLAFLSGILLLRRSAWGYLLASVAVLKFVTMGMAVTTMGLNMVRNGVPASPVELGVFPVVTIANLVIAVLLLRSIDDHQPARATA